MAADLVLIDGDLEALSADQIGQTGIALTVAGGRIIHQAHGFV
jgi:predicted amidohydrolase YtcJ